LLYNENRRNGLLQHVDSWDLHGGTFYVENQTRSLFCCESLAAPVSIDDAVFPGVSFSGVPAIPCLPAVWQVT
jgi:hypothetical protein